MWIRFRELSDIGCSFYTIKTYYIALDSHHMPSLPLAELIILHCYLTYQYEFVLVFAESSYGVPLQAISVYTEYLPLWQLFLLF